MYGRSCATYGCVLMERYGVDHRRDSLSLHAAGLTAFWLMHLVLGSGKIINLTEKRKRT